MRNSARLRPSSSPQAECKTHSRQKGSTNRKKAINKLGRKHLKISRQREENPKRLARCVIQSNDLVAYEDLRIKNLVKNHCLAKSINEALPTVWGKKYNRLHT